MSAREYGTLGMLRDEQLQAAADRFGLGRVRSSSPLQGGLFGKNVRLVTEAGDWVLRGAPWPPNSDEQYRRERFFARAIHERSEVPAPWPYHVESDPALFGWPYALMPVLPGAVLRWEDEHDWPALAAALGRAAADLRTVTWPRVGEWRAAADEIAPFAGTAGQWFEFRVERWLDRIATTEALEPASLRFVHDAVSATATTLDLETACYVHHDLTLGNVVARRDADGYAITGVFDLNEGYAADPLEDLARSLWQFAQRRAEAAPALLAAYRSRPRAGEASRLRAYVVADLLVIWEYGRRERMRWFGDHRTFRSYAEAILRAVDRALEAR